MLKTWDLAKKSHFTSVLSTEAENANFLHTMMIHMENGAYGEILNFSVKWIFKLTHGTTVNVFMKSEKNWHLKLKVCFCAFKNMVICRFFLSNLLTDQHFHPIPNFPWTNFFLHLLHCEKNTFSNIYTMLEKWWLYKCRYLCIFWLVQVFSKFKI